MKPRRNWADRALFDNNKRLMVIECNVLHDQLIFECREKPFVSEKQLRMLREGQRVLGLSEIIQREENKKHRLDAKCVLFDMIDQKLEQILEH
jgi:hypothetical protein